MAHFKGKNFVSSLNALDLWITMEVGNETLYFQGIVTPSCLRNFNPTLLSWGHTNRFLA
jgi:hypothetical protein